MNEVREAAEFGWNVVSAVLGAVLTLVIHAFRFGGRLEKLATKAELDDYVRRQEFQEFKADVKSDLEDIKRRQDRSDNNAEKRHAQVIEALLSGGAK